MPYENLSASLSDLDRDKIMSDLNEIKSLLPFLINLSLIERQQKGSVLRFNLSFIVNTLEIARHQPALIPSAISLSEWEKDLQLYQQLQIVRLAVNQLAEALNDTHIALHSELVNTSISFRKVVKGLAKTNYPGIDELLKKMA